MSSFIVRGGGCLSGEVSVSGSKNAALPIIFAAISARGVSVIDNMPPILDVSVALDILRELGATVERLGTRCIINTENLTYSVPDRNKTSRIRASTYLIGAMLARFSSCALSEHGGCGFDARPIDMHIYMAEALGAEIADDKLIAKKLLGGDIFFKKVSVGATVNALILSASAEGRTRIFGYAKEPHVMTVCEYLSRCGAKIKVLPQYIEVYGAHLHGADIVIPPDMIEAGSFAVLSLMSHSELKIFDYPEHELFSFSDVLIGAGAKMSKSSAFTVFSGDIDSEINVIAEPYPAFPTDLQPIIAPLLLTARGGEICDNVWRGRFGYLEVLSCFGAKYLRFDAFSKLYPSCIHSARVAAPDLRGGMAALMLAIIAKGESRIDSAEIIKRGYSDIEKKLRKIGVDIEEI